MSSFLNLQNQKDAKSVWSRFYDRYANLYAAGVKSEKKHRDTAVKAKKLTDKKKNEIDANSRALKIATWTQYKWKKITSKDTLITINPKGGHEQELLHLVNYKSTQGSVKRSFNKQKLKVLAEAMKNGDWEHQIFDDKTLPELIMSLLAKGTVSKQQTLSVLERQQARADYDIQNTHPIFKKDGSTFSDEAVKFLLPILTTNNKELKPLSTEEISDFKYLVQLLPKSEQYFYTTSFKTRNGRSSKGYLLERLVNLDAAYENDKLLIHLTCGVQDAFGLARFGEQNYVPAIDRFGVLKPEDIEEGVRQSARYAALSYPNTPAFKPGLHGHNDVNAYEAKTHDIYHSNVMSTIPPQIRRGLLHLIDVIRPAVQKNSEINSKLSLELWDYIDADFMHTFRTHRELNKEPLNEKETTELFCTLLLKGSQGGNHFSNGGFLARRDGAPFFDFETVRPDEVRQSDWNPTILGAIVYLDMIKNRQKWKDMKINPAYLIPPFLEHFNLMKRIHSSIRKNDSKIQWLKYLLYCQIPQEKRDIFFKNIANYIDINKEEILPYLNLDKIKNHSQKKYKPLNSLCFTYKSSDLTYKTAESMLLECPEFDVYSNAGNTKDQTIIGLMNGPEEMFNQNPSKANWCFAHPIAALLTYIPLIRIPFEVYIYRQVEARKADMNLISSKEMFNQNPSKANWCFAHPIAALFANIPFIRIPFDMYINRQVEAQIQTQVEAQIQTQVEAQIQTQIEAKRKEILKSLSKGHSIEGLGAKHAMRFFDIVSALNLKKDKMQASGSKKAADVIMAFNKLSYDESLNPNATAWDAVMAALQKKRGFKESKSYLEFQAVREKAKQELLYAQNKEINDLLDKLSSKMSFSYQDPVLNAYIGDVQTKNETLNSEGKAHLIGELEQLHRQLDSASYLWEIYFHIQDLESQKVDIITEPVRVKATDMKLALVNLSIEERLNLDALNWNKIMAALKKKSYLEFQAVREKAKKELLYAQNKEINDLLDKLSSKMSFTYQDPVLNAYIEDVKTKNATLNSEGKAQLIGWLEQLDRGLDSKSYLKEIYSIIQSLKIKPADKRRQSGIEKAEKVMAAFVNLSIEDRLNPNADAWGSVMAALQKPRSLTLFNSSTYHQFSETLENAKRDQNQYKYNSPF